MLASRTGSILSKEMLFFAFLLPLHYTVTVSQTVHDPMTEHIYFYPRPLDGTTHPVYVKPTELITRHRLQFVTDWPFPGPVGGHAHKPIDLVATAEVSSQPIYFRNRESFANAKLKQKQNILYLDLPIMAPSLSASENKVLK